MSAQHEYYVRQPADTEARGPFTLAQLASLASSGGIDSTTLYFDAATEQWIPAAGSAEIGVLLRNAPARTQTATTTATSPTPATPLVPAAPAVKFMRVLLFASAAALLLISFISMRHGGLHTLLFHPFFWLGLIDIVLGVCVTFFMKQIVLIIRLRAVLGFCFLGLFLWSIAATPAIVLAAIASACLWLATVLGGRLPLVANTLAGLVVSTAFVFCVTSTIDCWPI